MISTGKSNTQDHIEDGAYPFYVRSQIINRSDRYLYDEEAVLTVGDGVGTGKVYHYVNGKYDLHQRVYRMYSFQNNMLGKYFYYYFSNSFYERVITMTAKTSVDSVRYEMIADMEILYPSIAEQKKIIKTFSDIDNLITLHQRKYDKLVNVKKAILEKMFPKDGADVPEIRFKGFTEAWEQRKVGDFVDITTGKLDANAMKEDGKYDFYTSGIQKYKIDIFAFEGPAITIAGNGATVGYMHLVDGKFNAYQRTYVLTGFQADRQFLFFEIGNKLPKKISQEARTGNIPYIVMDMLTELQIMIPKKSEQEKIGQYVQYLDNLITLHQRKRIFSFIWRNLC